MTLVVTGAAGLIGFHLSRRLLDDGFEVVGFDNLSDYYEVGLKENRLALLQEYKVAAVSPKTPWPLWKRVSNLVLP